MSAEPTKAENQPAGEVPAAAPAETPQAAETKAAEPNPPAENAAAGADTPEEAKPAANTAATAAAQETDAKDAPKESKTESKDGQPNEESKDGQSSEKPKETALTKFAARLDEIKQKAGHDEMWGVTLSNLEHPPTAVVLQKYLRANDGNVAEAEKQLTAALKWRKENDPPALLDERVYDRKKFGDLGFVTEHADGEGKKVVITWNVYGAVKDNKATFGDLKEFLNWRVALMEFGTRKLNINEATAPIPDGAEDPYQMVQVHDYLSVSFLRMDPHIKAASKQTIETLSMAYPELLAHKYFVNVPAIMGWAFSAMKLFLSPATLRKFHPMSSGASLAAEMPGFAGSLPKEYGGEGPGVKEGSTVRLTDAPAKGEGEKAAGAAEEAPKKDDAPKEEAKEAPAAEAKPEEPKDAKPEEPKAEEAPKDTKDEPTESKDAEPKTQ